MTTSLHLDTLVVPVSEQQLRDIRAGRTDLLARLILAAAGPATGLEALLARAAGIHVECHRVAG
jgi:hypothetical protein